MLYIREKVCLMQPFFVVVQFALLTANRPVTLLRLSRHGHSFTSVLNLYSLLLDCVSTLPSIIQI